MAALAQWPSAGVPAHPRAWLIGTARHKALDWQRREAARVGKEAAAMRERVERDNHSAVPATMPDDQLALVFLCCHPALDHLVRVPLTLRCVCGLSTAQVAAAFLTTEATMAQRLTRAKRKIRDAGIAFRMPRPDEFAARLSGVLRVVYLIFTAGHRTPAGPALLQPALCEEAIRLARALRTLLPEEPEVTALLALLLLTDARRPGRLDDGGALVLLADQDRARWDRARIAEGTALLEHALRAGTPGPYQIQAAIAACHSTVDNAADTDWAQIAALYQELLRYEPTPVVEANRAVAVSMVDGPAAGLAILDALGSDERLARWVPLHLARADMLCRLGRAAQARDVYRYCLTLGLPEAERDFVALRLRDT